MSTNIVRLSAGQSQYPHTIHNFIFVKLQFWNLLYPIESKLDYFNGDGKSKYVPPLFFWLNSIFKNVSGTVNCAVLYTLFTPRSLRCKLIPHETLRADAVLNDVNGLNMSQIKV